MLAPAVSGAPSRADHWSASIEDVEHPIVISIDPPPEEWGPERLITFRVNTTIPWNLSNHFQYFYTITRNNSNGPNLDWTFIGRRENYSGYTRLIKFMTFDNENASWIRIKVIDFHGNEEISQPHRIPPRPPFPIFRMLSPSPDKYHKDPEQEVHIRVEHGERPEHPFSELMHVSDF